MTLYYALVNMNKLSFNINTQSNINKVMNTDTWIVTCGKGLSGLMRPKMIFLILAKR